MDGWMHNWSFKWITNWDEIWSDGFQAQWHGWMEQSCSSHVFFHPALARAWVETYLPLRDIKPLFLVARHDDVTVFFPLILWRRNWKNAFLREIIPLGYSDFDYHDPLIIGTLDAFHRAVFWNALLDGLHKLGVSFDRIQLDGVRDDLVKNDRLGWLEDEICPYCDISSFSSPDLFLPSLVKSLRGDLRRQVRRLEEHGDLTCHVYSCGDVDGALVALEQFLRVHAERWPKAYKALFFHENLIRRGIPAGVVHFSELRLNNKAISWHLGFVNRQRFYYYLPASELNWARYSPSKVHLLKCAEEAIRLKLSVYDHLRGVENYKGSWTDSFTQLRKLTQNNAQVSSRMKCFFVERVKPKLLKAVQ